MATPSSSRFSGFLIKSEHITGHPSKEFKQTHTETPWRLIEKMRHILVHDYFTVDLDFVWLVITEDLTLLKKQVAEYLKEF